MPIIIGIIKLFINILVANIVKKHLSVVVTVLAMKNIVNTILMQFHQRIMG